VIGSLEVGGTEMHLAQVLPELVRRGHEVAIHTLSGAGPLAAPLAKAGVCVAVPPPAGGRAMRILGACVAYVRFIREWRPDVIHFFLPEAYMVGAPIALALGRTRLAMARRSLNDYQSRRPMLARLERLLHGRMRALVGNAQRVVDQLAEEGAPAERLCVIRNGIDLTRFAGSAPRASTRAALGIRDGTIVLISVANLIPYKGHEDLIDALARCGSDLPDWTLLCVGAGEERRQVLAARAAGAGLAGRVNFLGRRTDVPDLLAAADIAVLTSHEEGFPNAVIEAMAAGLPVVATRVGGVPEAVVDGVTGRLVPPRDPAALSDAIRELTADAPLRYRMGEAGRARTHVEFALDACVARYDDLYARIFAGRPVSGG